MKISIITIAYNSGSTIMSAINSVLSQMYDDIEYIIIDGASTDDTIEKIRKEAPKFKGKLHWISEPDGGIYDAMNKGIKMAKGDIIGILNSDDFYKTDDVLETVARHFYTNDCDAVYGNIEFVSPEDSKTIIRYWESIPYTEGSFRKGWHPPHPSFFVKKNMYEKYGYFDTNLAVSADFELMLRFIEKNRIRTSYIPQTLVCMRYGGESTGSLMKIILGNRNILKAFKKNGIKVNPVQYVVKRLLTKVKQFFVLSGQHQIIKELA